MSIFVYDISKDVIDQLVGLVVGSFLYGLCYQCDKVVVVLQGSYDMLFDLVLEGIGLDECLLVVFYVCCLVGVIDLVVYYCVCVEVVLVDVV